MTVLINKCVLHLSAFGLNMLHSELFDRRSYKYNSYENILLSCTASIQCWKCFCIICLRTVFGRPYYRSRLCYSMSSVVCLSVTFCILAKRYVLAKKCLKEQIGLPPWRLPNGTNLGKPRDAAMLRGGVCCAAHRSLLKLLLLLLRVCVCVCVCVCPCDVLRVAPGHADPVLHRSDSDPGRWNPRSLSAVLQWRS